MFLSLKNNRKYHQQDLYHITLNNLHHQNMKKICTLITAFFLSELAMQAQITVDQNDFANAGDNVLVSNGDVTVPVDVSTTGANQTWDFSFLTSQSQDTLEYLSVSGTNNNYALYFANVGFNTNRSNIATPGAAIPTIPGVPITITDPYNFYYKNANDYRQQGLGAAISGFATPIAYGNKDYVYNFPLNFSDTDSCNSDWSLAIPGIGYYGYNQKRVNTTDGWGTVITPYGSFAALRVVSQIEGTDTLYADTLGFGFSFPRPLTKEYKWIAKNEKIPVLQITTTDVAGAEVVSSIVYPDSLRTVGVLNLDQVSYFKLSPNPTHDVVQVNFAMNKAQQVTLIILDAKGEIVFKDENKGYSAGSHNKVIRTRFLSSGIYTLQLKGDGWVQTQKIVINK